MHSRDTNEALHRHREIPLSASRFDTYRRDHRQHGKRSTASFINCLESENHRGGTERNYLEAPRRTPRIS